VLGWIVQGVIEPGNHTSAIAESRVSRDVFHSLTVNVDLAAIAQAL
jgi:hypothetical protein